ncbi:MAG TPA: DUF547 domain-containing protein [Desulfobacterales bacterium]
MRAMRLSAAVLILLLLPSLPVRSAPSAELWERWTAHDPDSRLQVDHSTWDRMVKTYITAGTDGVNYFAYGGVSEEDSNALQRYLQYLEQSPVSRLNRAEQKAFWINLYNALTVRVILDHYPVDSIRDIDISPGFFADGPWKKKLVRIEDQPVSLDDIEHRILRPIWKDPRIHYGVNCASIGCPNLQTQAFTAANTEALLDKGAREYVNHPRGARIEAGRLIVSSIYVWFQEDFGGDDAGVIAHLKKWAGTALQNQLEEIQKISDDQYDWALNDAARL